MLIVHIGQFTETELVQLVNNVVGSMLIKLRMRKLAGGIWLGFEALGDSKDHGCEEDEQWAVDEH